MRIVNILITFLLVFILNVRVTRAQNATIDLNIFGDLSTIDFAAFAVEQNLENQPRMVQITINPPGMEVIVEGIFLWLRDQRTGFQEVGRFRTKPFAARTFYNDEIGAISDIEIETSSYNSNLTKELLDIAKPSGIFRFKFILYDKHGNYLSEDEDQIVFLNPTPPRITFPLENSVQDIGSILVTWDEDLGVTSYKVLANYLRPNESYEQALSSGNLLVNNREVGKETNIDLTKYLDRELLADTVIVLAVKAVVHRPGGYDELMSTPVVFRTGKQTTLSTAEKAINPDLIRLADFLTGKVDDAFIMKLRNGEINVNQIQFTDENGNTIVFSDFIEILNYLERNMDAVINIQFRGR